MTRRVLVLGGYGVFGGRVARRLIEQGFDVVVAGRSLQKAQAFARGAPGASAAAIDRDGDLGGALAAVRPWAVVDAAGPFQGLDYGVARAAIAAGAHYVDLADGRDFVTGFPALDADAKAAGVAVISGASSVPALSGAVIAELAAGLERVSAVEISISASNRAIFGASVMAAVLSYAGRPLRMWRGGRWESAPGLGEPRLMSYAAAGRPPLQKRRTALADVPDLTLWPERLPGRPATSFRVGVELGWQNAAIALGGRLVRLGLLRNLDFAIRLTPVLRWLTAQLGGDRSATHVAVFGLLGERRIERRWTLIAEQDHGPEIPALAAPLIVAKLAAGRIQPGARDAGGLLARADFAVPLSELATFQEVVEVDHPPPPYALAMGARFDALPATVRAVHATFRDGGFAGRARVARGRHPLARLAAWAFGFPPAAQDTPVHVRFSDEGAETAWIRDFGGRVFASRVRVEDGLLVERFGPFNFGFELASELDGLSMRLKRWRLGPLPLPRAFAPGGIAHERDADGRFTFDVPITLPLVGLVVRYRGWLEPL